MNKLKALVIVIVSGIVFGLLYILQRLSFRLKPSGIFISFIFVVVSVLLFWVGISYYSPTPYMKISNPVEIRIKKGMMIRDISFILESKGIINSATDFMIMSRIMRLDRKIKAGRYRFENRLSSYNAVKSLVMGGEISQNITIPEGYNMYEIAGVIKDSLGIDSLQFINIATDSIFLDSIGIKANTAEGYLFPNTYNFTPDMTPRDIIKIMYSTLLKSLPSDFEDKLKLTGLDRMKLFTLASIVEKEAKHKEEIPIIASVYYNRLKIKMRLQADPTVLYAIKEFGRPPTYKELDIDSPYNTYKYAGLPPTPICNPGLRAIMGTLNPAKTDYLYFVLKEGELHSFASNIAEHSKNVIHFRHIKKIEAK